MGIDDSSIPKHRSSRFAAYQYIYIYMYILHTSGFVVAGPCCVYTYQDPLRSSKGLRIYTPLQALVQYMHIYINIHTHNNRRQQKTILQSANMCACCKITTTLAVSAQTNMCLRLAMEWPNPEETTKRFHAICSTPISVRCFAPLVVDIPFKVSCLVALRWTDTLAYIPFSC